MLNGLAGYIFGRRPGVGDGETNANAAPTAGRLTAANETTNNDIEDDDWILVSTEGKLINFSTHTHMFNLCSRIMQWPPLTDSIVGRWSFID